MDTNEILTRMSKPIPAPESPINKFFLESLVKKEEMNPATSRIKTGSMIKTEMALIIKTTNLALSPSIMATSQIISQSNAIADTITEKVIQPLCFDVLSITNSFI